MKAIWKNKPSWTIDPNPAQLSDWDAPDVPLSQLDDMRFVDLNGKPFPQSSKALVYKFPWYLAWLHYWYGLVHWLRCGEWPARILYFPKSKTLDRVIYQEVCANPGKYTGLSDFMQVR